MLQVLHRPWRNCSRLPSVDPKSQTSRPLWNHQSREPRETYTSPCPSVESLDGFCFDLLGRSCFESFPEEERRDGFLFLWFQELFLEVHPFFQSRGRSRIVAIASRAGVMGFLDSCDGWLVGQEVHFKTHCSVTVHVTLIFLFLLPFWRDSRSSQAKKFVSEVFSF